MTTKSINSLRIRMEALSQWAMYQEGISKVHIESFIKDLSEIEENANAEIATLRAQLAEARDILIVLAYIDNMLSPEEKHEFVSVSIKTSTIRAARAWYNKVTTA